MRFYFQDDTPYTKSAASASRARSFDFPLLDIFLSLLDHARQQRQKHLRVLLRIAFQCRLLRVALADSQRSSNLLGNHHTSQFVDSPHYARCSHKYCLLLLSFLFALPVWIQDIWNIPSEKMVKVDNIRFIYFIHRSLKGAIVNEQERKRKAVH